MTDGRESLRVVGVGASAGGLEALTELFAPVQPDGRAAYIVVQHLSPHFKSVMREILVTKTHLKVLVAEHDMVLEPDTVYLNTPHTDLELRDGHLCIRSWDEEPSAPSPRFPVDALFHSLATELGAKAVGVVLSGTGSDGSRGLKALHEAGGLTVVQRPATAQFGGMPDAALRATICNLVLPPDQIWSALVEHFDTPIPSGTESLPEGGGEHTHIERIHALLRDRHSLQLDLYKRATVHRRIERRAGLLGLQDVAEYATRLREEPAELEQLYVDLLIGVTRFFRDEEAFASLAEQLRRRLTPDRDAPVRAWVPACATGQEAYSVAMLLMELVPNPERVKVFGTDLHQRSIRWASAGFYEHESLSGVSAERLERFFEPVAGGMRVRKALRERVVFAAHDLLLDPPFSKVDLACCRNLLIYFNQEGQSQALSRLLFSLRVGGTLLLGPSESPGVHRGGLKVLDSRWKIYQKTNKGQSYKATARSAPSNPSNTSIPTLSNQRSVQLRAYDALLEAFAPDGLLLDQDRRVLHVLGDGAQLIQVRAGRPSTDVLDMLVAGVRAPVSAALLRLNKLGDAVRFAAEVRGEVRELVLRPLLRGPEGTVNLLTLGEAREPRELPTVDLGSDFAPSEAMERELAWTRESLQAAIEATETSNEELQASNEELVAANEELQSTNEELQSVNEELHTVNAEYLVKNNELSMLTSDLENLLASSEIAVVFLDTELCVRRFTPASTQLFNLREGDLGRPMFQISSELHGPCLEMVGAVLDGDQPLDRDLQLSDGRCFFIQARPYLDDAETGGVVLSCVNVSPLRDAQAQSRARGSALDFLPMAVSIWSLGAQQEVGEFRLRYANPTAGSFTGQDLEDLLGRSARDLEWAGLSEATFRAYGKVLRSGTPLREVLQLPSEHGPDRRVRHLATRGPDETVLVLMEDITEELVTRETQERERRLQAVGEVSGGIAHDLNNLLGVILLTLSSAGGGLESEDIEVINQATNRAADLVSRLLAYSKRSPVSPRIVRLPSMLERLRPMLESLLGPKLEFSLRVSTGVHPVRIDPTALEHVLINLAANARNAIGNHEGHVTLRVDNHATSEGPSVRLVFSDDGPGMAPEVIARCFEPFFSTQSKGLGSGLGLSSARGSIQQAGGELWVESELGKGTSFFIELPMDAEEGGASQGFQGQGATVLIVDDEEQLRRAAKRTLERQGFRAVALAGGRLALDWMEENGPPDLLISDVLMPEMNGPTLVEKASTLYPDLRVLFVSGYADHAGVRNAAWEIAAMHFLEKPFTNGQLIDAVVDLLGEFKGVSPP